ncbi:hypothetical protein ACWIUD_10785 [Helicobacter sp. 23-1044]
MTKILLLLRDSAIFTQNRRISSQKSQNLIFRRIFFRFCAWILRFAPKILKLTNKIYHFAYNF